MIRLITQREHQVYLRFPINQKYIIVDTQNVAAGEYHQHILEKKKNHSSRVSESSIGAVAHLVP